MDWLKLYWRDNTPVTEASYSSKFVIDASNIVINDTSVLERATEAVKKIISSNPPPYRLLVSGGVDSQAMLYAWKKSGVDFEAHTFIYDQIMNLHDIAILWDFVKIHGINLIHHHISHFRFLENDLKSYSLKYNCNSPHITFYMAMMDRFTDGTLILSGNPFIAAHFFNFTILGLERYRLINKKNIVPFFWIHTPELAGAWFPYRNINDKFRRNGIVLHMNEMKALYFSTVNIPVLSSHKKSGFEKYKLYYDNYKIDSKLRIKLLLNKSNLNPSRRPYDFLFRYTLIEANPISLGLEMIGIDYND